MANKLNILKTEYKTIGGYSERDHQAIVHLTDAKGNELAVFYAYSQDVTESVANTSNISADALNTYQAASILPSELLQQRNELIEIIKDFKNKVETGKAKSVKTYEKINMFLSKIEDEEMHPLEILLYKKFIKGDRFLCFGSGNVMTFEKLYYINKIDGRVFVFAKNDKGESNSYAIRNNNGQWAEKYNL